MVEYIAKLHDGRVEELRNETELDEFLKHFDMKTEVAYVGVKK